MVTDRIARLRKESLEAVNRISVERAQLVTQFYKSDIAPTLSTPEKRAYCLYHIFENKHIYIGDGELIVGERGPAPKATPTYPEVILHTLEDFQVLNDREKVSFKVSKEDMDIYENEIIPFWKGNSNRDKIMSSLPQEWHEAYEAGIFTEFQEQRAPGHTCSGEKIYQKGMLDIIADIDASMASLKSDDPKYQDKVDELNAMRKAAQSLITLAHRHRDAIQKLAAAETDAKRKGELEAMATVCDNVPAKAPTSFHEALQYYWFVHLGVVTEVNPWDSFNPGRLDQHLNPFYQADLASGKITRESAEELLQSFWIKFNNHPAPAKVGITAQESSTYTDFSLINMGGLTPEGEDGVNDVTYLMLDVIQQMRLLQPSSMIQVSHLNPDRFITRTLDIIKTGFGQPSVFNTDAIIQELTRQGKSLVDARMGGASGCVESGAFGREAYILTGYFNIPKVLEITLNNGVELMSGKKMGLETGDPTSFGSMDELMAAFEKQMRHFIEIKIKGNDIIESVLMKHLPVPLLSLVVDDCVATGTDYICGGARYNSSYVQGVGVGTITDSLSALNYHVFEKKTLTMAEMLEALKTNFAGKGELRYDLVYNTPKWGNDEDSADDFALKVFEIYFDAIDGRPTPRGGKYRINLLPTTCHVYFGSVIGALPDGRPAGDPVSEGISPVQGTDRKGPTAVVKSAAKLDHLRTGGTLLNQKFTPSIFDSKESVDKICKLIRTYFRMMGHHIQFNVVNADTLRDAQKHPEQYGDLIVRVAGYSDYFNDLGLALQNEIITRTEHLEV